MHDKERWKNQSRLPWEMIKQEERRVWVIIWIFMSSNTEFRRFFGKRYKDYLDFTIKIIPIICLELKN